jgi:hypothetical protein
MLSSVWTADNQIEFTMLMGDVLHAWVETSDRTLAGMFEGTDEAIDALKDLIKDGHLIEGKGGSGTTGTAADSMQFQLEDDVAAKFFAFAIPAVWAAAQTPAFIVKTGVGCDQDGSDFNLRDDANSFSQCVDGEKYHIASTYCPVPGDEGCKSIFTLPPGIDTLQGRSWGKLTAGQLVVGSVRTYAQNGYRNMGTVSDFTILPDVSNVLSLDVTYPGTIRLPVCTSNMAMVAWNTPDRVDQTDPNYPCVPLGGLKKCWDITYEDQTIGGSPPVSDCEQMVRNVQGTTGSWTTGIGPHRGITKLGKCTLGVENSGVGTAVRYVVGAGDVEIIVNGAIKKYGGNGYIGARGYMTCAGETKGDVPVKWTIY